MNRAPLHGTPHHGASLQGALGQGRAPPPRGPRHATPSYGRQDARGRHGNIPTYGLQDARGNSSVLDYQKESGSFAVQPRDNVGNMKLKKTAVKIVTATTPSGSATPAIDSSPQPKPVKAKHKEVESFEPVGSLPQFTSSIPTPPFLVSHSKLGKPSTSKESDLENLFARLNAEIALTEEDAIKEEPSEDPPASQFVFEDMKKIQGVVEVSASMPGTDIADASLAAVGFEERQRDVAAVASTENNDISQADLEQLYLRKAYEYLQSLPAGNNVSVRALKIVSKKLRSSYTPETNFSAEEVEKLQARYAFAIVNYVKNNRKKSVKPITSGVAKDILHETNGDMLQIFSKLVDAEYLSLTDIDSSTGLCQSLLDILPRAEATPAPLEIKLDASTIPADPVADAKPDVATTVTSPEQVPKDLMDTMKAWPTQEKRENPAQHRACILKGVSGVKNINELQALVWGGRLESIQLPAAGSDFAVVRFLTPEACDKYFNATENGIEIAGDKKAVIFVEKQAGPSSINDVMRNCTEGDASRCVRALDAEEDWSDHLLMKLARGKGQTKREVDCIKQGKTARGRHYVDFRFANIYHALHFKRQLAQDSDWEPCTISYATDPCETAQGVHYQDADE
ncbi:hypothetical protein DE146DRAFT_752764 [Phaeosphaeria sp. MPI-PUGE-AT-0046c]|nr:hypothetical protein DE146DRAFT_752764 [Phaeosphaeria sp. MPI-PUGE-AT-0046c]